MSSEKRYSNNSIMNSAITTRLNKSTKSHKNPEKAFFRLKAVQTVDSAQNDHENQRPRRIKLTPDEENIIPLAHRRIHSENDQSTLRKMQDQKNQYHSQHGSEEIFDPENQQSQLNSELNNSHKQKDGNKGRLQEKLLHLKGGHRKIEDLEDEERLNNEARNFVIRLKKQKEQMVGKYHYIKMKAEKSRKMKQREEKIQRQQEKQRERFLQLKERENKIEFFRKRATEREHQMRERRILNDNQKSLSKSKRSIVSANRSQNSFTISSIEKPEIKSSAKLGNKYLISHGKVKRRAYTQSSEYESLSKEEKSELEEIQKKIEHLTKLIID